MLTKKKKQILDYIKKYIKKNDYSPSHEEIAEHFDLAISTVHQHIEELKQLGYLNKLDHKARTIDVSNNGKSRDLIEIPLLGIIAAGQPIEAIENQETIMIPKSNIGIGEHFALKVQGNSMVDEGIFDGDTVIILKQNTAENGQTIVALINGNEVTLKKIYKEKKGFRLQPANITMDPIFVKNIKIQGKVISVIRNFSNSKIDISFKKTCNCPTNHINCLSAKQWMKNQVAIWEFSYEKRDIRNRDIHPAVFPIALPSKCIELFTHQGELVLDPFAGVGTTLIAAQDLNRNAIGFDLNKKYVDFIEKRLSQSQLFSKTKQIAICDDSINIPNYISNDTIALSMTSPPYANLLNRPRENKSLRGNLRNNKYYKKIQQYSNNPRDLGTMEPKIFAEALGEIYKKILPLHKPGAHCVINITDLWWENKRIPLHIYVIEAMQKAGYEFRNTIIWDRRNLVNNAGIFGWPSNYITLGTTLEYILDFRRPK